MIRAKMKGDTKRTNWQRPCNKNPTPFLALSSPEDLNKVHRDFI